MAKNTKVILRNSANGLGQSGDVIEVAAGYARNYLIPQGYAYAWSKGAATQIEQLKRAHRAQALATREDAVAAKATIDGSTVEISAKVSESGKLFGAIAAPEVAQELAAQGTEVSAKAITVENIKTTGDFTATVQLHPEISAQFTVKVVAE